MAYISGTLKLIEILGTSLISINHSYSNLAVHYSVDAIEVDDDEMGRGEDAEKEEEHLYICDGEKQLRIHNQRSWLAVIDGVELMMVGD